MGLPLHGKLRLLLRVPTLPLVGEPRLHRVGLPLHGKLQLLLRRISLWGLLSLLNLHGGLLLKRLHRVGLPLLGELRLQRVGLLLAHGEPKLHRKINLQLVMKNFQRLGLPNL